MVEMGNGGRRKAGTGGNLRLLGVEWWRKVRISHKELALLVGRSVKRMLAKLPCERG